MSLERNRTIRRTPRARATMSGLSSAILLSACASTHARTPAHPSLAGTWTLVAADREFPDGRRVPDYGDRPQGRMMIDEKGRYSIQIFGTDRQRFASGSAAQGTPEEYRAALLRMST